MERDYQAGSVESEAGACPASMHEGVETWDDLCSCLPEPRWASDEAE